MSFGKFVRNNLRMVMIAFIGSFGFVTAVATAVQMQNDPGFLDRERARLRNDPIFKRKDSEK